MTDRENVIRGFECCLRNDHKKCPYYSADILDTTCYTRLHTDALALLKEQEAVKPIVGYGYYICGVCKNPLNSASQKFCSECGQEVKWDDRRREA